MSDDILVKEALRRREVFENLDKHLETVKQVVKTVDPGAEVYLFGSVLEGTHTLSSDVDILVATDANPAVVHAELWKAGIKPTFEIHVHTH
ncbi:MAG: nucleotidyltransferase domain-containing protein [Candidatus Caldarchaeum sp.]|nr:nucleotidyltransferase domain-containing protein [Candidatus Caldarchaeum sp.]